MSKAAWEFREWYREMYKADKDLPCLRCSAEKVWACSKLEAGVEVGCVEFKGYLNGGKVRH